MKETKLSPDAAPVAREVHRRMIELGLTQKNLAELAGVNETYIRDLYAAKSKNPRSKHLSKVASALGCTLLDLTDPGKASGSPATGDTINDADELALVRFWRKLTPIGRQLLLYRIHKGPGSGPTD